MVVAKEAAEAIKHSMKKLIATVICLVVLSMTALPVAAQRTRRCDNRTVYGSRSDVRYDRNARYDSRGYRNDNYRYDGYRNDDYRYDNYRYEDNRSVWDKHRDKITTAAGAGGGAAIGAIVGGTKGAIIGAIAGGAGAAIYTYKIRDKNRRY